MPAGCPICGSERQALYLDDGAEIVTADEFGSSRKTVSHGRILRCCSCGFGFRQVRPNERELARLYRQMDSTVYEAESAGRLKTATRHMKMVERYARPGRLLDVGCASGLFLSLAHRTGWQVTGVEPSEVLFRKAEAALKDIGEVYCQTLEAANLPAGSFDALTLWDVLEHVPDPLGFLQTCRDLLRPGGLLFLNIPNLDSLESKLLVSRWPLLLA